jgi:hypothetical protein
MHLYEIIAISIFAILFTSMYLSFKMDQLRGTDSVLLKFLFGVYAAAGVLPVFRTAKSTKEHKLKHLSNTLLVVFWILFALLMLIIWIEYH